MSEFSTGAQDEDPMVRDVTQWLADNPATHEPAGDLVERIKDALQASYISGAQDVHDAWVNCGGHSPGDRDDLGEGASDYVALIDVAAIAAMPDHAAAYEDGYNAGELKWADAMDKQIGIEENLRTHLAASQADVARLREAIERARKAPMIDHRDAANSVYGILEAAIKDTQP